MAFSSLNNYINVDAKEEESRLGFTQWVNDEITTIFDVDVAMTTTINVNVDAKRHEVGGDEVGNTLLTEASGVANPLGESQPRHKVGVIGTPATPIAIASVSTPPLAK